MTPDIVNGVFEFLGAALTFMNVRQVWRDKGHKGLYVPAIAFFMSWGLWNLFYYPHLGQWVSFLGGAALVIMNVAWVSSLLYFGKAE